MHNSMDIHLTPDRRPEAVAMIAHHLEIAGALFESLPEGTWQDVLQLISEKGLGDPTQSASEAFVSEMESHFRALDREYE